MKKDRKPFHETKVGNWLFNTAAGSLVMESAQALPGVGTYITKKKEIAEGAKMKHVALEAIKEAAATKTMKPAPQGPAEGWTWWERYRLFLGAAVLYGALKTYLPAVAEALEVPFKILTQGLGF